jgi:hypothetical protein
VIVPDAILRLLVFCPLSLLCTSCCVTVKIDMENQARQELRVFSGPGEKVETVIEAGKTRSVPHVSGTISVMTVRTNTWHYPSIDVPIITADAPAFKKLSGVIHTQLRLHLLVQSDGKMYAVPVSRSDRKKYLSIQPVGFPLVPATE